MATKGNTFLCYAPKRVNTNDSLATTNYIFIVVLVYKENTLLPSFMANCTVDQKMTSIIMRICLSNVTTTGLIQRACVYLKKR